MDAITAHQHAVAVCSSFEARGPQPPHCVSMLVNADMKQVLFPCSFTQLLSRHSAQRTNSALSPSPTHTHTHTPHQDPAATAQKPIVHLTDTLCVSFVSPLCLRNRGPLHLRTSFRAISSATHLKAEDRPTSGNRSAQATSLSLGAHAAIAIADPHDRANNGHHVHYSSSRAGIRVAENKGRQRGKRRLAGSGALEAETKQPNTMHCSVTFVAPTVFSTLHHITSACGLAHTITSVALSSGPMPASTATNSFASRQHHVHNYSTNACASPRRAVALREPAVCSHYQRRGPARGSLHAGLTRRPV
ncbi:hypothetical protein PTSG_04370 [Salpingoeca rosetta]|uniref:Uncharacterized protein n=1 Tax=Salpingoeca rosetta (strain ATCC 50818 / BSB-021) TaxID=946362 RepID=F2U8C7_SALR5|nr:uncharacterized protein PTSG_04370 [Salpingoeca rosetta]EGD72635.1 hypothetical protein PTSG_04370 [Salpingoeca rosetta]|eukprot:XP_004994458.1 hypothetical protein PTSG_04370 [Salpingoeca rosetta]